MKGENGYTQDVLGRHVVIEFAVDNKGNAKPYLGRVCEMKAGVLGDGSIETLHLVVFNDGDKIWFDLEEQEKLNSLTWVNSSRDRTTCHPKTTTKTVSPPARARVATKPAKRYSTNQKAPPSPIRNKRKARDSPVRRADRAGKTPDDNRKPPPSAPNKKRKVTRKPSPNRTDPVTVSPLNANKARASETWLDDMPHWMEHVPYGRTKTVSSRAHTIKIMRQVKKMAFGEGITCSLWPEDVFFYAGVKVDLS